MPSSRLDSGRNANGTTSYICPATCVRMCYVCVFAVCELGALVYPPPVLLLPLIHSKRD